MSEEQHDVRSGDRQLVVFHLAGEAYGIDIGVVREIIRLPELTVVPDMPHWVEGVINLRGRIRAMIDLRKRLGLRVSEATSDTRVLVIDVGDEEIGAVVDAVTEVRTIDLGSVQSADSLVTGERVRYVEGIVQVGERLLILLNVAAVTGGSSAEAA